MYIVKKVDAALFNLVTVNPTAGQTIDGIASISLAQRGEAVMLESDGTIWRIPMRRDYDASAFRAKGATLNQWYTSPQNGTPLIAGTEGANNIFVTPFVVSKVTTIDQMAINVTTLGAGSTPRVGIYADNGNLQPGALVVDAGTQSGAATGVKTYTTGLPVTLDTGLYWLAYLTNGTAPGIRSYGGASPITIVGYASTLPTNAQFGWSAAFTFAALPATFPSSTAVALTGGIGVPAVFVRISQ
jgi:hypothetical protein